MIPGYPLYLMSVTITWYIHMVQMAKRLVEDDDIPWGLTRVTPEQHCRVRPLEVVYEVNALEPGPLHTSPLSTSEGEIAEIAGSIFSATPLFRA